ncbi:right-handed parallel beta-helix repeat-containing protein [Occallatibacter riparius]|uniref:Right-handed parallel beta-helix repeat-containing protein n=1 Tax=Occallatibacter riparius TaxID=1002689 RepID=A0A9J7BV70_9BACT|nr:right-handed parallel beta-helix repeat-containing protein [Occallatibacter riparius]UWZ86512.1 right-handed parallel beta-helix repeat-containing protein [Occallatibacter riparius]
MIPRLCSPACLGALVSLCLLAGPAQGSAQQFTQFFAVDCSNPAAQFPTISSALAAATDGTSIWVPPGQTCTENVTIGYLRNIAIGTDWAQTFNLNGSLTIQSSQTIEIQGMVVTNPHGDGINVNNSTDVSFTFVQSVNNSGMGLAIATSNVTIGGAGAFSNNGGRGINAGNNSLLSVVAWGGNVDISNNVDKGINLDRSVMMAFGTMTITNTHAQSDSTTPTGSGIAEFGGAKAGLFALFGPVTITGNEGGGILLWESSEISTGGNTTWAPYLETIQANGPFGISSEFGGSLTVIGGVTISDHTTAGISLYGNSQAAVLYSNNQISHNGTGTDSHRAGILVEQGSQLYLTDAIIRNNGGPGVLGLTHATLDIEGSNFSSNAGGAVACDKSSVLETDLPHPVLGSANSCTVSTPGKLHAHGAFSMNVPDWKGMKAHSLKVNRMITSHRRPSFALPK